MIRIKSLGVWVVAALLAGCAPEAQKQGGEGFGGAVEASRVDGLALNRLRCDGFEALPLQTKLYAYHLYRAALAGRDVAYDQTAPRGLEIRRLLDGIMTLDTHGESPGFREKLNIYAVKFWAFSGNYDPETRRKFVPGFTPEQFLNAVQELRHRNPALPDENRVTELLPYIFDEELYPMLVVKNPPPGMDVVSASAVNHYDQNLTLNDVEKYKAKCPLNSHLASAGGGVVEEVYRAGAPDVTPGRMAESLQAVITELEAAMEYAPRESRPALRELVEFFRTGDNKRFVQHQRLWVADTDSPVDYILGFVEVYDDPLAQKGTYEGMVFVEDPEGSRLMRALAADAPWFEARMPWDERFKKGEFVPPAARAFQVLGGFGDGGPLCPSGINLPNFQFLRETVGTKNFLLTNVMQTGARERAEAVFGEFLPTEEERALALEHYDERRFLVTALHEVIGHGSGRVEPAVAPDPDAFLKEFASTLEEARANLAAYWFVGDPHLVEISAAPPGLTREGTYTSMLTWALVSLRDVPQGDTFEEDHARAGQLIANFIIERGGGERVMIDGKHYQRLVDVNLAHEAVGELLAEVMRIKGTGDYAAARRLVETYGVHFDPALRDEVVARTEPLNLPDRRAYIMPELHLVRNRMGGVRNVAIEYPEDFAGQMLRFGGVE